ncbi:MAG: PQQ-dependent sugar dehydrogenase [Thermoflexales bacterium]|nr:PQQ-dependent sugar dehydrogenase [Thermoflexales bacterium]
MRPSSAVLVCGALLAAAVLVADWRIEAPAAAAASAEALAPAWSGPAITFTPVITSGLDQPLFLTHDGTEGEMYIAEKQGKVRVYETGEGVLPTPFLTVSVTGLVDAGLLGLAFEPDYETNGRFYITYVDTEGNLRLERRMRSATNPYQSDPLAVTRLITLPNPDSFYHYGGWIGFGPDDFLYMTVGDGGPQDDPHCNGQDASTLHGSILRLDVIGELTYTVPVSNAFVSGQAAEVWARGVRSPWRASFDRGTGDLYFGDVGYNDWEEINRAPAGSAAGLNFGWNRFEGPMATSTISCPDNPPYQTAIVSYTHAVGNSVIGGYVYRGYAYPWLQGLYFYGDYGSGRLAIVEPTGPGQVAASILTQTFGTNTISSLGEDARGELYAVSLLGTVYRMSSDLGLPPRAYIPSVVHP